MNKSEETAIKISVTLIICGGLLFWKALKKYKVRQRIQNTPRSKISSAALGNFVEVHGKIFCENERLHESPLSKTRCATYMWAVERYERQGKSSRWIRKFLYHATPFFYIQDESEDIAGVDISSCDFHEEIWTHTRKFSSNQLNELPPLVGDLLKKEKLLEIKKHFLFESRYEFRILEKSYVPGEDIFVLGRAIEPPKTEQALTDNGQHRFGKNELDPTVSADEIFKIASKDKQIISNYDKNNDKVLDNSEREKLYKDILKRVQSELQGGSVKSYLSRAKFLFTAANFNDLLINERKVYVSSRSEKELLGNLAKWIWLGFLAGPILVTLGVWFWMNEFVI